jgi:purine-cytosine permease-like protein
VFVPLFGVLAAHYAIVRRGYTNDDLYATPTSMRTWGIVAWALGFFAFNWINPGTVSWWGSAMRWLFETLLSAPKPPSWLGASLFAFVVAFALQGAEALRPRRADRSASPASVP